MLNYLYPVSLLQSIINNLKVSIMATISIYNKCIACNKKNNRRDLHTGSVKPNLKKLFGVKNLVNQFQLKSCCEAEKRRHLYEDAVLRFLYIENNSN